MIRRSSVLTIGIAILVFWGLCVPASGQSENEIRIDNRLVMVPVAVFDRDGRHVGALRRRLPNHAAVPLSRELQNANRSGGVSANCERGGE